MTDRNIFATLASLTLVLSAQSASAGDTLNAALDGTAQRLGADAIADRFVGQTGTWVSADGSRKIDIFYGEDNALSAQPVGGDGQMTGFYGITDTDEMCISWDGGGDRLRCLDVVERDGAVAKYNADGSFSGIYDGFRDGKSF